MRRWIRRASTVAVAIGAMVMAASISAQNALDETQRTNGKEVLKAIAPTVARIEASRVLLGETKEKVAMTGVIFAEDGYVLTKWSEIAPLKKLRAWLDDGTDAEAQVVKHDERLDLALVKIPRTGLPAAEWSERPLIWQMGQWLCAPVHDSEEVHLGIMGAKRRAIPNSGAVLGVRFEPSEKGDRGVTIEEVAHEGPAQQAGLRAGDVLLLIDGETVNQTSAVRRVLLQRRPGDVAKVHYAREGKEADCEVRLGSANHVLMNWTGGDFANHGTSQRTDNFPDVIQHALPMTPQDMGGAIYDLQGLALGLNIARVDRVTNYALPAETFLAEVRKWVEEERSKK